MSRIVVLQYIIILRRSLHCCLCYWILGSWFIRCAIQVDAIRYLHFQQLHTRFDSQVSHLDVKPMEVDATNALFHILCKFAFTDLIKFIVIGQRTGLVKLTEQFVYLVSSVIKYKAVPITKLFIVTSFSIIFKVGDNFWEVPWESKNICMFLLRKDCVNSEFLIDRININWSILCIFHFYFIRKLTTASNERKQASSSSSTNDRCLS